MVPFPFTTEPGWFEQYWYKDTKGNSSAIVAPLASYVRRIAVTLATAFAAPHTPHG
jgi:hypothetical protein